MPSLHPAELTTPRLRLRAPAAHDRDALFAIYGDPEVMRYGSGPAWQTLQQADAWLQRAAAGHADGSGLQWMIERLDAPGAIGACVLFHFHIESRRAEVGYILARAHWGRGYMQEAFGAMIEYAFQTLDLRRLEADIDPDNLASARALERQGFVPEGRLRERWEVAGQVSDSALYGLLRHEWAARRP